MPRHYEGGPVASFLSDENPYDPSVEDFTLNTQSSEFAKAYLESATTAAYLDGINPHTEDALADFTAKVAPLARHLPEPQTVASIGVGSGDELLGLARCYDPTKVRLYGVDLSSHALAATNERLATHGVSAVLLEGDATNLPLEEASIDGIVSSALMHEVYSYLKDGKLAWIQAVAQLALVGTTGSRILLRDFAAPNYEGMAEVVLKTSEARRFYEYFSAYYRTFRGNSQEQAQAEFLDTRDPYDNDFPKLGSSDVVQVDVDSLAELLLHFKYCCADMSRGVPAIDNPKWKEINETYLPPNPELPGIIPMTTAQYGQAIVAIGNQTLANTRQGLQLLEHTRAGRPAVAALLSRYFGVRLLGDPAVKSETIIADCTHKMELVFGKFAIHATALN